MIFVIHLWLYILFAVGVLLYVAARWAIAGRLTLGCRAATYGLFASLLGLVVPFVLFFLAGFLLYGHAPPYGGNGDTGAPLLALLLLLGPLVGPPAIFIWVVLWYVRRHPA